MACVTADGLYRFEGLTGNILFLYNLFECPTSPITMSSHFFSLKFVPFPFLHVLCGDLFQFSVMLASFNLPSSTPSPFFYKDLAKELTVFKGLTVLYSVYLFFCIFFSFEPLSLEFGHS